MFSRWSRGRYCEWQMNCKNHYVAIQWSESSYESTPHKEEVGSCKMATFLRNCWKCIDFSRESPFLAVTALAIFATKEPILRHKFQCDACTYHLVEAKWRYKNNGQTFVHFWIASLSTVVVARIREVFARNSKDDFLQRRKLGEDMEKTSTTMFAKLSHNYKMARIKFYATRGFSLQNEIAMIPYSMGWKIRHGSST